MVQFEEDVRIIRAIADSMEACIMGKTEEIRLIITALLSQGHILLEDVPGTGKTVLIKALARSIQGQFRRIQCNPDLLPSDITGVSIFHPKDETFVFRPGPVMTNILLADEVNRATTKTQSALLEAMEERIVTIDGDSHPLPTPFLLLATQNPIDFEGTYTLPEAQLDRFMMKLTLGYPDEQTELKMVYAQSKQHPLEQLQPVAAMQDVLRLQERARAVHMDEAVAEYGIQIVRATREHQDLFLGGSPRATLSLLGASKAYALVQGREYVIPDDIKYLTPFVLKHRLLLRSEARMSGVTEQSILDSIMEQVKVPVRMEK